MGAHSPAYASESVISAIAACKAIADDRQRLECLDNAVANVGVPTTVGVQSRQQREQELAQREADLKRREALLKAKSEVAEQSISLFGINFSSANVDSLTIAAAGLPQHSVERGSDGAVESITANVRKWSYDSGGRITVVLDDGQVWRQTDTSEVYLAPGWKKPHRVRIARAVLGFMMTVDDKNKGHKVRRIGPGAG